MIHVCPLARLHETLADTGARHLVSLIGRDIALERPPSIVPENHLWLEMHDICSPLDGYLLPETAHVERLIGFVRRWDRASPIVVHCHAGISRSTAAAFVSVCALSPHRDERAIAQCLRRASPTAMPNALIVALADRILDRRGRMTAAVAAMGPCAPFAAAGPFRLDLE